MYAVDVEVRYRLDKLRCNLYVTGFLISYLELTVDVAAIVP